MEKLITKLITELDQDGWDAINNNKNELLKFDGKELIISLLNNQNLRYSHAPAILVIIPEIWKDFSLEDWKQIMRKIERPKKYRVLIDDSSQFEDIRFLCNWIGIDGIKLYKEDNLLSKENKEALDKVFPGFLFDHIKSGDNKEDFEDGTFGKLQYLLTMRKRLLSEGASPIPSDLGEFALPGV